MIKPRMFHSATIPDSRLMQGILGLRGIAAFAVVLSHISYLARINVPEGFRFIERDFAYGAHLFFVLSAFSLMHSTEHTMHRSGWARDYLLKRFFRIAPLFYTVLACMLALHAWEAIPGLPGMTTILLNVFFVFGFMPGIKSGLVWAGWTIGVEMIFYVLFPVLLMVIKTKKEALILVLLVVPISYVSRAELHAQFLNVVPQPANPALDWSFYGFVPNLYFFAVGIYAYKFWQALVTSGKSLHVLIPLATSVTICLLLFTEVQSLLRNAGRLDLVIWAFGFGALCVWQSAKPGLWSANKIFEYLGERSFSIYLLHPPIIYFSKGYIIGFYSKLEPSVGAYAFFICALFVVIAVLIAAEITYRAIEVPGIRLGHKVIGITRGKAVD